MSQANNLLDNLPENDISTYTSDPEAEGHIVVNDDRSVSVPQALKRIAVQYDHNVETVTFDCPRYWDGLDMSGMVVYINYMCTNGYFGYYAADNVSIDEINPDIMHFDWTISRNVTQNKGTVSFLVCIKKIDPATGYEINHWNSELNSEMYISEGMEWEKTVKAVYPDVVTELLLRMGAVERLTTPESLQTLVDNYISANPSEVLDKIKEVATPDAIQDFVNSYLDENPPEVDDTLSVSGMAADAKATRDAIEQAKTDIIDDSLSVSGKAADAKATSEAIEQAKTDIIDDSLSVSGKAADAKATSEAIETAKQDTIDILTPINVLLPDGEGWHESSVNWGDSVAVLERAVTYGGGKFVMVGECGSSNSRSMRSVYSTDGINWSTGGVVNEADTKSSSANAITYGDGKFVAVGYYPRYSTDGVNWTTGNRFLSPAATNSQRCCTAVAYGNGMFVAVASPGGTSHSIFRSVDAITWEHSEITKSESSVSNVIYGNGIFVLTLRDGRVYYSTDANTWTMIDSSLLMSHVGYNPTIHAFVGIPKNGGVYTSTDGQNWTLASIRCPSGISAITYGMGKTFALSEQSVHSTMNGSHWVESSPFDAAISGASLTVSDNAIVVAGTDWAYCLKYVPQIENFKTAIDRLYGFYNMFS